jgi:hypothetical protein
MGDQLIDWLKEDLQSVKADVKEINGKIDEMLEFKWQIVGGSVVISLIVGVVLQFIIAWAGK